jgi:hypothetical protein
MKFRFHSPAGPLLAAVFCLLLTWTAVAASAKELRFEAQLVWATMSDNSPDPTHKPVESGVRKRLAELPLKWKSYFEVKRENVSIERGKSQEAVLSRQCKISIKDIDGSNFEVALIGKGESVLKRTQKLPKGDILVLGGNAPDASGWLVVVKRIE